MAAPTVGTGTTVTFSTGFIAEPLSIDWTGFSRESIRTSHMGTTTAHTFGVGDLYDPGQVEVSMVYDPATSPVTPMTGAQETITITYPDAGAATIAASGEMISFEVNSPLEDRMTATCTLKLSGTVTHTP